MTAGRDRGAPHDPSQDGAAAQGPGADGAAPHDPSQDGAAAQGPGPDGVAPQEQEQEQEQERRRPRRRAVRRGAGEPDPLVALRSEDDSDVGWQAASDDSNDDRLRRDVPPHW